eukprot:13474199-Alexandrium_andersonii.AAC.1
MRTSSRVTLAASISRRSHQQPTTMSSLGPIGPPFTQGSGPSGSSGARARGKGAECFGGPSPLREARFALLCAWARRSVHGWPSSMCCCLAPERVVAADR